jgi:PST family polysaccharide transporter
MIIVERVALVLGVAGLVTVFALRRTLSVATFGDDGRLRDIGIVSVVPLLTVLGISYTAQLQGSRRVGDLARANVVGVVVGTAIGLPILYLAGVAGVAPYLIALAAGALASAWWYARKVPAVRQPATWHTTIAVGSSLLRFGFVFMLASLASVGASYIVRVLITRQFGLSETGLFAAASALANVYVGFILGAMGADFYPHLVAVGHDNTETNRLVNTQVEFGILVATPAILAMLALGPVLLRMLYSAEFAAAFPILRWQVLGTYLRVVSWPLSYLVLSRGEGQTFFWMEVSAYTCYAVAAALGMRFFGLPGTGAALFAMYVYYVSVTTVVGRRISGFRWSRPNLSLISGMFLVIGLGLAVTYLPTPAAVPAGLLITALIGYYCLRAVRALVGPGALTRYVKRALHGVGLGGAGVTDA